MNIFPVLPTLVIPICHPCITLERGNTDASFLVYEESKTQPFSSHPVYFEVTK